MKKKTFILGLDGVPPEIIKAYTSKGFLKNINILIKEGAFLDFQTVIPPMTSPAWKTITSGYDPGFLGVYGFLDFDKEKIKIRFINSRSYLIKKDFWDVLAEKGFKIAVINVPFTYPVKHKKNLVMISGHPSPLKDFYPPSLRKILKSLNLDKIIKTIYVPLTGDEKYIRKLINKVKLGAYKLFILSLYFLLNKDFDIVFLVLFSTDKILHFLWDKAYIFQKNNYNPVLDYFSFIDKLIGILRKIFDQKKIKYNIFIISDHGMQSIKVRFQINSWLYYNGYLKLKKNLIPLRKQSIIRRKKMEVIKGTLWKLIINLNLYEYLYYLFNKLNILERVADFLLNTNSISDLKLYKIIDWEKTVAFATQTNIYLLHGDKNKLKKKIIDQLKKIRDPKYNLKIFKDVIPIESIYRVHRGNYPDILLIRNENVSLNNNLSYNVIINPSDILSCFQYHTSIWKGDHSEKGIFVFYSNYNNKLINKLKKKKNVPLRKFAKIILSSVY